MDELAIWAQETEPQSGKGVRIKNGAWKVILASYEQQEFVNATQARLESNGIATQTEESNVNGKTWYRLMIDKLESRADAEYVLNELQTKYEFTSPWIINR